MLLIPPAYTTFMRVLDGLDWVDHTYLGAETLDEWAAAL